MEVASLAPSQSSSVLESELSRGGSSSDSESDARPSSVGSSRSSINQVQAIDTMAARSSSSSSSSSSSTSHSARSLSRCLQVLYPSGLLDAFSGLSKQSLTSRLQRWQSPHGQSALEACLVSA
eukprot:1866472-Rhodomonas_salina.1